MFWPETAIESFLSAGNADYGWGLLAIATPKGWVRSDGPGLLFFLPKGVTKQTAVVWIYVSSEPIGPKEETKDLKAFVNSDISGFKQRFKSGIVKQEQSMNLPYAKVSAFVNTFQSNEENNSFERVVYIPDTGRVLILVLSAKTSGAFAKASSTFEEFAKSYRGSITPAPSEKKP